MKSQKSSGVSFWWVFKDVFLYRHYLFFKKDSKVFRFKLEKLQGVCYKSSTSVGEKKDNIYQNYGTLYFHDLRETIK